MIIDKSKLARQNECLDLWELHHRRGTIEAATGFGKTFLGILAIWRLKKLFPELTVKICVPSDLLRNHWRQQIEEHKISNVQVDTINMWVKEYSITCDLFILDEIHGYTGGEVFSTVFDRVKCEYILGLTAKERDKEEDKEVLNKYAPIVETVTMKECLEKGWVAPFKIYNLGLTLDKVEREYYNKIHSNFLKYFSTFNFKLNLMYKALEDKRFLESYAKRFNWDSKMVFIHAVQANRLMQERKKYLYNNKAIFNATLDIINRDPTLRTITFSEITSVANKLYRAIPGSVIYHSNIPTEVRDEEGNRIAISKKIKEKGRQYTRYDDGSGVYNWNTLKSKYNKLKLKRVSGLKIREEALELFESGKAKVIHTSRALNEGMDIHGIERSIKTSFNSTTIDNLQRTGRAVRIDHNNPDKLAIEINLYIKDSQSYRWLVRSQKEAPQNVIRWVDSIDEIT